jgi:prepilin-type N-terminal cleavage/methylation domain-containing protein
MPASNRRRRTPRGGFTIIELMVVVALIGIFAAVGAPKLDQFFANQRAKSAARSLADAFRIAQGNAIRTGDPQIVFLSAAAGANPPATDPAGTALGNDPDGRVWPALVIDDGTPAASNCVIDAGEALSTVKPELGVAWGISRVAIPVAPGDTGGGNRASGSTFRTRANGADTTWVMFRPDGIPVGFDAACNQSPIGEGGGAVYITNGVRDYAVVLTPLGGVKVHGWNPETNAWTD